MKAIAAALLLMSLLNGASKVPTGKAANDSVDIAATFLDAAATKIATGSDFNSAYTVIEVTVTPKGSSPLELQPDDFLLRINSNSDNSGPMAAAQVYGAGGGLVLQSAKETIGITPANLGYSGTKVEAPSKTADPEAVKALQSKMLPAKKITAPAKGLLFFPIAKKKSHDLDLVYTSPTGKLHIAFK